MEVFILGFLLIIGLTLILVEILFIPGTTIFGIFGIISIFLSDYLSYQYFGSDFAIYYSIITSVIILSIIIYSLKSNTWKKLALNKVHREKVEKNKYDKLKVGDIGTPKYNEYMKPFLNPHSEVNDRLCEMFEKYTKN